MHVETHLAPARAAGRCRPARARRGAVLTLELLWVLPIVLGLLFALVEFGLLWSASHVVKDAATAGCRVATFPGADEQAVRHAIERTLQRRSLVASYRVQVERGRRAGDEARVRVEVPMGAASPDLLRFLGLGLRGRTLSAVTVMRME